MTASQDFNFDQQSGELGQPSYPVVFGVSLNPKNISIAVAVLGVLGGVYMILNMVMPAWDIYQQKRTQANDLQSQVDQKKVSIQQIDQVKAELAAAKEQSAQVLSLFANPTSLNTLLLDLNRLIESTNARVRANGVRARLQKFVPVSSEPEIVKDGSLGATVDGKLKRSIINVEIEGTFEQNQAIMRNIERLQPLLIIKNYQASLSPPQANDSKEDVITTGPAPITTSFDMEALMPLTPEEMAAVAAAAAAAAEAEKKP